ncbi:MAG: S-layer protein domain-containing protein [Methanosarcinaceae archaeon]
MQYTITQNNIKILSCILIVLILGSCYPADAKSIKIRGTPGSVKAGSTMDLDGFNFPELYYRIYDGETYEWLNITFAKNGTINKGDASYTTKTYSSSRTIMFMGSKYYSLDPDEAYILSKKLSTGWSDSKKTFKLGEACEVCEFSQNYTFTVLDIDQGGEKATLQLAKNGEVVKIDVVGIGETFEYKTDIANSSDITIFKCKVDTMMHGTDFNKVKLKSIKHYCDTPMILKIGDEFGNFEITSITNNTIEMKNTKIISCSRDETVVLMDGWLDLKVSEKGDWGYVYSTKTLECPEPVVESPVTESTNDNSTAQNTTASNVSGDTGANSPLTAAQSATLGETSDTASTVTTGTEQPMMLSSTGGGGTALRTLPSIGIVSLASLFAILVYMNIRKK